MMVSSFEPEETPTRRLPAFSPPPEAFPDTGEDVEVECDDDTPTVIATAPYSTHPPSTFRAESRRDSRPTPEMVKAARDARWAARQVRAAERRDFVIVASLWAVVASVVGYLTFIVSS